MLAHVAPGGRVVGLLGETTLLRYFRDVLGQRRDVTVIPADKEADRLAAVDCGVGLRRARLSDPRLPGTSARYSLDAAGPLIAVSPKAQPTAPPSGQSIGAGILLADAMTEVRRPHGGPVVPRDANLGCDGACAGAAQGVGTAAGYIGQATAAG